MCIVICTAHVQWACAHKEVEYKSVGYMLYITSKFHNYFVVFNVHNVHLRIIFLMHCLSYL
jgi:hypothetical protein